MKYRAPLAIGAALLALPFTPAFQAYAEGEAPPWRLRPRKQRQVPNRRPGPHRAAAPSPAKQEEPAPNQATAPPAKPEPRRPRRTRPIQPPRP